MQFQNLIKKAESEQVASFYAYDLDYLKTRVDRFKGLFPNFFKIHFAIKCNFHPEFLKPMMEMASMGSKVLHFRCVEIAAKYDVKIHLRSTFEDREGTWIVREENMLETPVVSSVTHDANTAVIELNKMPLGIALLSKLFDALAEKGINVDIISQNRVGMKNHPGVASRFFKVFAKADRDIKLITTSDIKISAVIEKEHLQSIAEALHSEFGLDAVSKSN